MDEDLREESNVGDDGVRQVEISHGSTSNQTSIYASTVNALETAKKLFCNSICIFVLLSSLTLIILFCYGKLPLISAHFQDGQNQHEKIVILSIWITLTIFVLLLFLLHCARRYSCFQSVQVIWHKRKSRISANASALCDEDNADDEPAPFPEQRRENSYLKLNELSDSQLEDIKRILTNFKSYHDESDWSFSLCSHVGAEHKTVLGSTPPNLTQSAKVKLSVKVVLVGPPNVGKTSIFHRILYDRFTEYYMATLGVDLGHITLQIFPTELNNSLEIALQVWDIAGSERFSELSHIVYKDVDSFVIVCDVTLPSFSTVVTPWIKDIVNFTNEPSVSVLLNKMDLQQKMLSGTFIDKDISKLHMYSVSAKTGKNVLNAFVEIVTKSIHHGIDKLL